MFRVVNNSKFVKTLYIQFLTPKYDRVIPFIYCIPLPVT